MKKRLLSAFGLRSAVIFVVLLPLLATFGLGSLFLLATLENSLEERMQEEIELIARTLQEPVSRALERGRERTLERALRSTFEFGRVYGAYVYDHDGELIARADDAARKESPDLPELGLDEEEVTGTYNSVAGREVFSYFIPLIDAGGQVIGMLQVTRRASEMQDYIVQARWNALVVMIGFASVFIAVIVLGHHFTVGRPMRRLAETMREVESGNRSIRVTESGPAEIRELGHRLNAMIEGLELRDAELARERSKQLRLQSQLRAAEKFALVGRLASGVAHELGSPLSVIDGHLQRLLRDHSEDDGNRRTLLRMQDAAARMSEIVTRLLGFGGESSGRSRSVAASQLLSLAIADARGALDTWSVTLETDDRAGDVTVHIDLGRMREALAHLVRNGAHAAAGGRLRLSSNVDDDWVTLCVEDSGPGIPTSDRERIFEPFFTTKPPEEGSGLGLAIVKGIVLSQGGDIEVDTSPLGGALFRIRIERFTESS